MLQAKLFGTPEIRLNDRPLPNRLTGRKLAALSYLLVTGRPCSRGSLADLLWDELPEQQARKNLRNLLYGLRQQLPDHLTITHTTVAINQGKRHWSDVHTFTRYMATEFPPTDTAILQEVLRLYQGEFLEGTEVQGAPNFDHWITTQRLALQEQHLHGSHWLSEHHLVQKEYSAGLTTTRRALTVAPWDEISHQQQMLLLAASGRHQEALAQYERCRQMLVEEYGTDPQPATTLLYQQLKGETEAATALPQHTTWQRVTWHNIIKSSPIQVNWEAIPQQPRLIGRDDELTTLTHWLYTERTPLMTVIGLPGQGKTALLAELVLRVVEAAEDPIAVASTPQSTNTMPAGSQFKQVIWYSVAGASTFSQMIEDWLQLLVPPGTTDQPVAAYGSRMVSLERRLTVLMKHLRQNRCLLILDQVEAIGVADRQGHGDQPAYAELSEFLRRVCTSNHASAVVLLSRAELPVLSRLRQVHSALRFLSLGGLSTSAGVELLQHQGITGKEMALQTVVEQVDGHPLALLEIAALCRTAAVRNPLPLLAGGQAIFGRLKEQLQQQFQRLTSAEQELLIRLAYQREPADVEQLWCHEIPNHKRVTAVEALQAIQYRALVMRDRQANTVALAPIVLLYLTNHLVDRLLAEIYQICRQCEQPSRSPDMLYQQTDHRLNGDLVSEESRGWENIGKTSAGVLLQTHYYPDTSYNIAFPTDFYPPLSSHLPQLNHIAFPQSLLSRLYLNRYPLLTPHADLTVQKEQRECLVEPLVVHLHEQWGVNGTQRGLHHLLTVIEMSPPPSGHLAANIQSLLSV